MSIRVAAREISMSSAEAELDRIREQIGGDLFQAGAVPVPEQARPSAGDGQRENATPASSPRKARRKLLGRRRRSRPPGNRNRNVRPGCAPRSSSFVDEPAQAAVVALDRVESFPRDRPAQSDQRRSRWTGQVKRRQRAADLVRHDGKKVGPRLQRGPCAAACERGVIRGRCRGPRAALASASRPASLTSPAA